MEMKEAAAGAAAMRTKNAGISDRMARSTSRGMTCKPLGVRHGRHPADCVAGVGGYPERMGQSTPELPADTLMSAVDNARRGVVTHITIKGERVAAIVSESTLAMAELLAALLGSETALGALPAVLPGAFPWARFFQADELKTFAGELCDAVAGEASERVEVVLDNWRAVAEVRAGARST